MNAIKKLFILIFIAAVSGCGGSTTDSSPSVNSTTIGVYEFSATVESLTGAPSFPINIGDIVTGTFSYNPSATNTSTSSEQGAYIQKIPATTQTKIGNITVNADLNNWVGYRIDLYNNRNDVTYAGPRDTFSWVTNDTSVASQYGLDYIQVMLLLEDLTANSFSDTAIPANLNLSTFSTRYLYLSGTRVDSVSSHGVIWFCRAQITSLTRTQ